MSQKQRERPTESHRCVPYIEILKYTLQNNNIMFKEIKGIFEIELQNRKIKF